MKMTLLCCPLTGYEAVMNEVFRVIGEFFFFIKFPLCTQFHVFLYGGRWVGLCTV